jgi:hypothetical protein
VPLLNAEQRAALRRIVEAGPNPAVDGVVRWRLIDLAPWASVSLFCILVDSRGDCLLARRFGNEGPLLRRDRRDSWPAGGGFSIAIDRFQQFPAD